MPIETISFAGRNYPLFQSQGFAAQFAIPFAKHICKGEGYDIGCNRVEWALPGAYPIDPNFSTSYDAYNLPDRMVDYIFSSHCAEHLLDWVEALDYWTTKLRPGGVLFLYLPHPSQEYWLPFNNRKHIHSLEPEIMRKYFEARGFTNIFISSFDLNNSFYAVAEKP